MHTFDTYNNSLGSGRENHDTVTLFKNKAKTILEKGSLLRYFSYNAFDKKITEVIKKYRTGTQDVYNLMTSSNLQDSTSLSSLNLSPIKIIPSFVKKIKQRMTSDMSFPTVRSHDPISYDEHREIASQLMYEYMLTPLMLQMGGNPSEEVINAVEQASAQQNELPSPVDLYNYIMGIKTKTALASESIINKMLLQNDFKTQLDLLCENIICFNIGFLHIDTHYEIPKIKAIPTEYTIYPPEAKNNFDLLSMRYGGYIEKRYVQDILKEYDFELDKQNGKNALSALSSMQPEQMVNVMYFFFTEKNERKKYIKKGKKYKNIYVTDNRPEQNKNYDVEEKTIYYNIINEGYYLPDYNCLLYAGRLPMATYPDKQNPVPPIIGASPNFYFGEGTSIVEDIIPYSDAMHIALLKILQLIAKARPKGVAIDLYAMAETLNSYSSPIDKDTIIEQYNKEGNVVFTSVNEEGERLGITLQELVNGIDRNTLLSLIDTYNFNLSIIRFLTGINEAADVTDPNPKALVGVQQIAVSASLQSTKNFVDAVKLITDHTYTNLLYIVANMARYTPESIIKHYYSDNVLEGIDVLSRISTASMYIDVKPSPSEEEISAITSAIQIALQTQKINELQLIEITKALTYEHKAELLRKFIEENNKAASEAMMQQAQQQRQLEQENAMMKAQTEIMLKEKDAELKAMIQEQELKNQIELKERQHEHKMREIALLISQQEQMNNNNQGVDSSGEGKLWSANKQRRNLLANFFRVRR